MKRGASGELAVNRSTGPDSDSEGGSKKLKTSKKERRDSKHKKPKEKKSKADKKLVKAARRYLQASLKDRSDVLDHETEQSHGPVPLQPREELTKADYFVKNPEFTTWIKEIHRLSFDDLTSDDAHSLFEDFIVEWNKGSLPAKYYAGEAGTIVRTTHVWRFKGGYWPGKC
eukprot:jgi/Botrbrau1/20826/Bobra.0156s0051.1